MKDGWAHVGRQPQGEQLMLQLLDLTRLQYAENIFNSTTSPRPMEDDKKRKRGLDDQDNYGQGIENITLILPKRSYLKHMADLKGIQESLRTKNEILTRKFSLIKPSSTTQTIAYWHAPYHLLFHRAIPNYFSSINQQLVPTMVAPTTKQFIFSRSLPIQPLKPPHTSIAHGTGQQQLRPPHMTIPCCPLGNHSSPIFGLQPCAHLNNISTGTDISDFNVEPTISINSNDKYNKIYDYLKACIDSNTTNSTTTECATPNTQDFVASICLNEIIQLNSKKILVNEKILVRLE
ncbi:hypothetical protein SAY87_009539 [Trapa incisa]|uniref:Uncharacterized protein n=1 Tax=Trapa incisa TaxID=236973 RepID=A0AAN7JZ71_9MYRT|nr:hypothetical protein SAY87_009539 [Trapa incisa]